jgi:uncharacterized protein YbjT (DUF2867 family)
MSRDKTVLITGATGFIGQNVIPHFLRHGYEVRAYCRRITNEPNFEEWKKNSKFSIVLGDLFDQRQLDKAIEGVNYVRIFVEK